MGLGGNLIWTGVFNALKNQSGDCGVACDTPMPMDLLRGRLYRLDRDYRSDLIFRGNPDIGHVTSEKKPILDNFIDKIFEKLLSPDFIRRKWELFVFQKALKAWKKKKSSLYVHIDMRIHSYASGQTKSQTFWKEGGCAAHVMAEPFGLEVKTPMCRFFPEEDERQNVRGILNEHKITGSYIVVEPDTNRDWFGELRSWPFDRWQKLVDWMVKTYPEYQIVQTGLGRGGLLKGVVDLTGKTTFREAASLIEGSCLFLGTEGGLMHLAAAVNAPSVILWGGITLPEFAGYPHKHNILCHYVDCAPCGHAGWCDNDHQCMKSIDVEEVSKAVSDLLVQERQG